MATAATEAAARKPDEIDELIGFLALESRGDIRGAAMEYLLGLTGAVAQHEVFRRSPRVRPWPRV